MHYLLGAFRLGAVGRCSSFPQLLLLEVEVVLVLVVLVVVVVVLVYERR
jgi:hypothetical protein